MSLVKKLLTKPVWWCERKRMFQRRRRWRELPPISSSADRTPVALLTTPGGFEDSIWSAWSWLKHAGDVVSVRLHVDGTLSPQQRAIWHKMFPGSIIAESIKSMATDAGLEKLLPFITSHPMGRKLMLPLILQKERCFLYSDSDVILFRRSKEILDFVEGASGNGYIQEESEGVFDSWVSDKITSRNLLFAETLNGGLFLIRKDSLDIGLAGELLGDWNSTNQSWFTEQTVMSVLMAKARAEPLPRAGYVVSNRRQFFCEQDVDYSQIVARHFTGTTRHVLYNKAISHILSRAPCK